MDTKAAKRCAALLRDGAKCGLTAAEHIDGLAAEVERLTAENNRYKAALKEIMGNQNDFCTTCDENVDTAADALNWPAAEAVRP